MKKMILIMFFIISFLIKIYICQTETNSSLIVESNLDENNHIDTNINDRFIIQNKMDLSINKHQTSYYINLILNTKYLLILISVLFGIIIILSIIYSCCKVPLKSGYKPRHCMRCKYFLKGFLYILFFPCVIIYHCLFILFSFLDGVCWDQQLEQRTFTEQQSSNQQNQPKQKQYIELSET